MTESVASLGVTEAPTAEGARPSIDLPIGALIRISAFWLGLTSIDAVVNAAVQARLKFDNLVAPGTEGMALAFVAVLMFVFSVAVQPTVGSISDYTTTRWGRRKPYIVVGALLDVVFLVGIATANSLLAIAAFVTLLAVQHEHRARSRSRATSRTSFPIARSGLPARWSACCRSSATCSGSRSLRSRRADGQRRRRRQSRSPSSSS